MRVLLCALLAFALVAGAVLASVPAEAPQARMPEQARLQAGDAAAYDMVLSGGWAYEGTKAERAVPGPRFEVLEPSLVTRADGSRVHAFGVLTQAPATTLLPSEPGRPTWSTWHGVQWLDGVRVATQSRGAAAAAIGAGATSADNAVWTYPDGPLGDCLLTPLAAWRACDLPYLRIRLGAAQVEDLGVDGSPAMRHLRADDGTTRIDWWFAPEIPVPVRVEVVAPGLDGMPERSVALRLSGFLAGEGPDSVLASSFAPAQLAWMPRQVWGPDDSRSSAAFPLSAAYQAAWNDPAFPDLHQWMARHDGYVFSAEPARDRWDVHLSDGQQGFSFSARLVQPLLPLGQAHIEIERIKAHHQAAAAPRLDDAPDVLPSVASMWDRWADHARGDMRREGANVWAFRILEAPTGPVVHYAVGRAASISWGVAGIEVLGVSLGGSDEQAAVLVVDGGGQAMSFHQTDREGRAFPAASAPYVPSTMPFISQAWPWSPAATGVGVAAAGAALVLPKLALALFTRFRPGELLEHPMRATIMDAVRAEPGVHFRALCSRLGANPGRVRHHLRKLIEGAHITERASPGYTCYFPHAGTPRSLLVAGPLMRSEGARSLIGCLAARPGTNAKELASVAGLSPATATYHLKRLQEVGLVDAQRDGRSLRLHLTPDGEAALAAMG